TRRRSQRARPADVLARGAGLEPDAPGEPVRARAEAITPAGARVELADQIEQARGGGGEMRRELGDLVTQTLQLDGVRIGHDDARTIDVHRGSPCANSTPRFSRPRDASRKGDRRVISIFSS